MIFKMVKFFIKLGIWLVLGVFLMVILLRGCVSYVKQGMDTPVNDVSYMITAYEKTKVVPEGTWCQCPVCGDYYYKGNTVCCSQECENKYRAIVQAYNEGQVNKQFIEGNGKKFR